MDILTNPIEPYRTAADEEQASAAAEYITISAFAKRAGVTPQAVYKRLDGDLAPHLTTENGIKLLSTNALTLFINSAKQQTQSRKAERRLEAFEETNSKLVEENKQLHEENQLLRDELSLTKTRLLTIIDSNAKQVEELSSTIKALTEEGKELKDRLLALCDRQMQQSENYQILLSQQLNALKPTETTPTTEIVEVDNSRKNNFFQRIFAKH